MQCASACNNEIYSAESVFETMEPYTEQMDVQEELIPHCQYCGNRMRIHSAFEPQFVHNQGAYVRWQTFLEAHSMGHPVVLQLGIGWRNQLIKAPMMRLVAGEPNATYVTINLGEIYIADNIKEKSYGLDGRQDELLPALREACEA